MSWQDRLRSTIDFTSPEGDKFSAKWKGDSYTLDKKVAEFDFPDFQGTIAQDLGTRSRRFPLSFYFDGADHDKEVKRFDDSLRQIGKWDVIHPVLGPLSLQPISINPSLLPTDSGNQTLIASEWIEPADDFSISSSAELAASALTQTDDTMATAAGQADANTIQNTAKQTANTKSAAERTLGSVQKTIKGLVKGATDLNNKLNQTIRSIQDTIDDTIIPILQLSGQIKELLLLPQQVSDDFNSRIEQYQALFNEILGITPEDDSEAGKNTAAMQELVLTGTVSASALICTNSDFSTKQEAIDAAEILIAQFNDATNKLDESQNAFKDNDIDLQYFSQSQSFSQLYQLTATALKYLLSAAFDLSIEKTITLTRPTIPAEVVVNEFGSLGVNDFFLNAFISINKLKNSEILVMPPGKEVVVYV